MQNTRSIKFKWWSGLFEYEIKHSHIMRKVNIIITFLELSTGTALLNIVGGSDRYFI